MSSQSATPVRGATANLYVPYTSSSLVLESPLGAGNLSSSVVHQLCVSSLSHMGNSSKSSAPVIPVTTLCLVGRDVQGDEGVDRAANKMNVNVVYSE
jgi:hypothetical protein